MKNETADSQPAPETCASCGAKLKGEYCRKCGEKKIVPERDFSAIKFLTQTVGHIVHFDSKLLRTCWLLFSKPGFLTSEWIAGRRVRYMKPWQLFVVAGLLFYFFLPTVPAHFSKSRDFIIGFERRNWVMNTFQYDLGTVLTEKAAARNIEASVLETEIDNAAAQKSKTWLFLIIPFWGTYIYLLCRRKIPWLVPHLVFAMHGLTFYILSDLLIHIFTNVLGVVFHGQYILLTLLLTLFPYLILAACQVYGGSWRKTILSAVGIEVGLIIFLMMYRQAMTIWTISSL